MIAVAVAVAMIVGGMAVPGGHAMRGTHALQTIDDLRTESRQKEFLSAPGLQHPRLQTVYAQRFRLAQTQPLVPTEGQRNRKLLQPVPRRTAEELYKATSRDAETFEAALWIPEIRMKLERALHQKLPDELLRHLADQSKLEARYWYQYMQNVDRTPSTYAPGR